MLWYITAAVMLILIAALGFRLSGMVIHPRRKSYESTLQSECEKANMDKAVFDRLPKEEVRIKSQYGYELYGIYFPNGSSNKTVIICHGITYTLYGSVKYIDMFLKRGFNVLLYDHRNHGKSGGTDTTFGYYEKYDLKACTDWVLGRCGEGSIVGTHGESMGAAIAIQNCAIDPRISFCIADCPFSDLAALLKYRLRVQYKLPSFPAFLIAGLFVRLRTGMMLTAVAPIRDAANTDTPIMFIHGEEDLYIPTRMSIDMFNVKKGARKLYIAPKARHAEAVVNNKMEYDKLLGEFLEEIHVD